MQQRLRQGCDLRPIVLCLLEAQFPKNKATTLPREVARLCGDWHIPLGMEEGAVRMSLLFVVFKITLFIYLWLGWGTWRSEESFQESVFSFLPPSGPPGIKLSLSSLTASTFTDEPSPNLGWDSLGKRGEGGKELGRWLSQ